MLDPFEQVKVAYVRQELSVQYKQMELYISELQFFHEPEGMHAHTHTHSHAHTHAYAHTCTHTQTHIHTLKHTHARAHSCPLLNLCPKLFSPSYVSNLIFSPPFLGALPCLAALVISRHPFPKTVFKEKKMPDTVEVRLLAGAKVCA